ncbi:hypothetical protein FRC03_004927 [Tulasnella sp. 419]|nr:hypothetical protein FRC03_004927 [Tulasnella sp. 419]
MGPGMPDMASGIGMPMVIPGGMRVEPHPRHPGGPSSPSGGDPLSQGSGGGYRSAESSHSSPALAHELVGEMKRVRRRTGPAPHDVSGGPPSLAMGLSRRSTISSEMGIASPAGDDTRSPVQSVPVPAGMPSSAADEQSNWGTRPHHYNSLPHPPPQHHHHGYGAPPQGPPSTAATSVGSEPHSPGLVGPSYHHGPGTPTMTHGHPNEDPRNTYPRQPQQHDVGNYPPGNEGWNHSSHVPSQPMSQGNTSGWGNGYGGRR